jgi:uroporphyrinogen-III synthase
MPDNAAPLLLLTRPTRVAERFAARFDGQTEVVIAPLQEIVPLSVTLNLAGVGGLAFTSGHAVERFATLSARRDMPAFCVGDRTAEVAQDIGLAAKSAAGTVDDLAALILATAPKGEILHLHGQHLRGDLTSALQQGGLDAKGLAVYAQTTCPPPPAFHAAITSPRPVIAPLFSPRSAELFVQALGETPTERLVLPCLSPAIRAALPSHLQAFAEPAATPDAEALAAAISRHISP